MNITSLQSFSFAVAFLLISLLNWPVRCSSEGTITCYDLVKISHEPLRLGTCGTSELFSKHDMDFFQKMVTIDLCSGIGGFEIEIVAFLDHND